MCIFVCEVRGGGGGAIVCVFVFVYVFICVWEGMGGHICMYEGIAHLAEEDPMMLDSSALSSLTHANMANYCDQTRLRLLLWLSR